MAVAHAVLEQVTARVTAGGDGAAIHFYQRRGGFRRHVLRYSYRNRRPTRFGRIWSRAYAWMSGHGLTSQLLIALQPKDRGNGQLHPTILVGASVAGSRYVISMLGENSEWIKNVRAAGGMAFIKRGELRPVKLAEASRENRAPILKAWSQVATSGRQHLPISHEAPIAAFDAIAGDYPVFRIVLA